MAGPAFMPMFWADYFAATRRLTTEQHGAYLLIIGSMWAEGEASMPVEDLPAVAHCAPAKWAKIWPVIKRYFTIENGVAHHDRVAVELEKASQKSAARSAAGKRGGEVSALKRHDLEQAFAEANAGANGAASSTEPRVQKEESTPPNSGSLDSAPAGAGGGGDQGDDKPKPKPRAVPKPDMPAWMEPFFDRFWAAYPNKKGKLLARRTFRSVWAKVEPKDGVEPPEGRILTLLAGVEAYTAFVAGKPADKVAHPSTWLNDGRWADEYGPEGPSAPGGPPRERFAL